MKQCELYSPLSYLPQKINQPKEASPAPIRSMLGDSPAMGNAETELCSPTKFWPLSQGPKFALLLDLNTSDPLAPKEWTSVFALAFSFWTHCLWDFIIRCAEKRYRVGCAMYKLKWGEWGHFFGLMKCFDNIWLKAKQGKLTPVIGAIRMEEAWTWERFSGAEFLETPRRRVLLLEWLLSSSILRFLEACHRFFIALSVLPFRSLAIRAQLRNKKCI